MLEWRNISIILDLGTILRIVISFAHRHFTSEERARYWIGVEEGLAVLRDRLENYCKSTSI
jgi:hypothetical protein